MPRRKLTPDPIDPIAFAARRKEKEERIAALFHPISNAADRPEMKWLIPGFIPKGYLCLLAADPKEGKSCLATALALAVATGTPFAGMPTSQSAVLWLSMEEGPHERNLILDQSPLADPATPLYTCFDHLPIDAPDGIEALESWIDKTDAGLIVVDPLHGAQSGRSLNDGWRARKTLKHLKHLCVQRNVAALVLHHAKNSYDHRPSKVAENAQLAATASMDIVLTHRALPSLVSSPARNEGGAGGGRILPSLVCDEGANEGGAGGGRLVRLTCRGRGAFANRALYLLSRGALEYTRVDDADQVPSEEPVVSRAEQAVLGRLALGSRTSTDLLRELRTNEGSLRNAITNLRRRGLIRIVYQKGRIRRYGLAAPKHENECANEE